MKKVLLALCCGIMSFGAYAETYKLGEAFSYSISPNFYWFKGDNRYCEDAFAIDDEGNTVNNPLAVLNINWPALAMEDEADLATNTGLGMIWFNAKRFGSYEAADEYAPVVADPWNKDSYAIEVKTDTWDGFGNVMFALPKMNELCRIRSIFRVNTEDGECTWNNPAKPFWVRLTDTDMDGCITDVTYQQENIKFWEEPGYRVVDQYYQPNGQTYFVITFDAGGLSCQRNVGFYLEEVSCVPVSKIAGNTHTEVGVTYEIVDERPDLTVIIGSSQETYTFATVDVKRPGEFAETYLSQNNYDWSAVQHLKVTGNINDIDLSAIKNLTSLMKLDLSETTITSLPDKFMYNRSSLVEVKLPSTLKSIGNSAFYGCSRLQSFDLNGITSIGSSVFKGCRSLSYINLTGVQSIGHYAFEKCSSLNNIDLSTVIYVGCMAFYGCSSLESIDLTSAVFIGSLYYDESGYSSFENCTSLKEVTFGDKLREINSESFRNTAVENISLPNSLTYIGSSAFEECKSLVSVDIPSSITYFGSDAFSGCTSLSSVSMSTGLTSIGSSAFYGCTSLSSVSMNTGLTSIGSRAFYGCTSLEEVAIPPTVISIGSGAFDNTGIKNFKCYAVVPPTATSSFIGGNMDMSRTYLHVPPFSKDFYRNTEYWSNFYLMRSIEEQIDYILVHRPLTINLEEEDNYVVANSPEIVLSASGDWYDRNVGQLTTAGEGTLSAGQMTVHATLSSRSHNSSQYCPTLINYSDKMRADNVTINLSLYNYYSSGEWHFISLPFDVKVSDIIPSDNTYWVIRRYDSAARAGGEAITTWVNLTNEDVMEAGKGYIISAIGVESRSDPKLSFISGNSLTKNNLFRPADITVSLTEYPAEFAHNRSWNLIGNPYPCYFDMHYLNDEFTSPITIWNGSAYVAYSPVDDDLVLSPYEAFFVQCPLDATEMTFKEGGRMHSNEGKTLYKVSSHAHEIINAEDRNVFNFILSCDNYEDRARIVLNSDAKLEYEIGRDASKFFEENKDNAQIYVNDNVIYSINERPVNDGMAVLGIRSSNEKVYTLSLTGRYSDEWNVMLIDNETGITVNLSEESYQFTSGLTENSTRFSIKFMLKGNGQSGLESIVADFGEDSNVAVTALNGDVVYNGKLADVRVPGAGLYLISNAKETRKAILK